MKKLAVLLCLLGLLELATADQVTLHNGDHFTGAIVSMDGKKLNLKTPYAGDVAIDRNSVSQFSSDLPLVITKTDQQVLSGRVHMEGSDVLVTTSQGPHKLALAEVTAMRSPADQSAYEKSLHPGVLDGWEGGGNFGFALARGNSETTNLALGFKGIRKTSKDEWILDVASIYSRDQKLDNTTANAFQGLLRYNRNMHKRLFRYGVLVGGYDALQNLNYRILPGAGLGLHAIATSRTTLDLLGGLGYTRESYTTGLTRNLFTGTLGDEFEYKLTKNTIITQDVYYLPEFTNPQSAIYHLANYRVTGNFGISTKLNGWMTANMNLIERYNSQPVLGNKKNDLLFATGLGFKFGGKATK